MPSDRLPRRPAIDRELRVGIEFDPDAQLPPFDAAAIAALRETDVEAVDAALAGLRRRDVTLTGFGDGAIEVSVLDASQGFARPAILFIHGGGMVGGTRWGGIDEVVGWIRLFSAVAITVDYRLAPEHPDPTPVEDCFAALQWVVEHAAELGVDPARVVVAGASAGGGLAAGVALLARDRGGPAPAGQLLICPMLDDRGETTSAAQYASTGIWNARDNRFGWSALLGERRGGPDVSVYAAPARAGDLSDLAPAFIDCGSSEVFRDEDVAYASRIWADGGDAELHVWPGGFHGFDAVVPAAAISRHARDARCRWLARILSSDATG
ncbi:alpha/beta hydrolase [Schumannella luteola]